MYCGVTTCNTQYNFLCVLKETAEPLQNTQAFIRFKVVLCLLFVEGLSKPRQGLRSHGMANPDPSQAQGKAQEPGKPKAKVLTTKYNAFTVITTVGFSGAWLHVLGLRLHSDEYGTAADITQKQPRARVL